jgi:hypothetical protein
MLSFDDERWQGLAGGYRTHFDPRPLLLKLESNTDEQSTWQALWEELHHQGDAGEASYAAVPHIVRTYCERGVPSWNTYAIVAVIDLARDNRENPDVPNWLKEDYFGAIHLLAERAAHDVFRVKGPDVIRAVLSVLAIAVGARTHAKLLINYSAEELLEMERLASEAEP